MDALSSELVRLLAQEPRVFTISLQCLTYSNCYLSSIDATLYIAINVATLVRFGKWVVEIKEGYSVALVSEVRIVVVVTTHIVNLTVCYEQLRYLTLQVAWQCLIEPHATYNLSKLRLC